MKINIHLQFSRADEHLNGTGYKIAKIGRNWPEVTT